MKRWRRVGVIALAAGALVLAGLLAFTLIDDDPSGPAGTNLPGLLLPDGRGAGPAVRRTVDRVDTTAWTRGPWSVIVRRPGGSLRQASAVVTWPVDALWVGKDVQVGEQRGTAAAGVVTWPAGGAIARVRGDLTDAELLAIARGTRIAGGQRLRVTAPDGLRVVWTGPYNPPLQREARYAATEVGEERALGEGLVFTSVQSGGSFEDRLFALAAPREGITVQGRRAVVAPTPGNGILAWELRPGVVALVGWSGEPFGDEPVAALQRLAAAGRVVGASTWRATEPQRL